MDNPSWKVKWVGKQVRKNNTGEIKLKVEKGASKDEYGADGLSGATITSDGVTKACTLAGRFWFHPDVLSSIGAAEGNKSGGES